MGTADTPGPVLDVDVSGPYAYTAEGDNGLRVIDIMDPFHPSQVGSAEVAGHSAVGVSVQGIYAYVAYAGAGLQIADVSDPANPEFISSSTYTFDVTDIEIAGDYAYLASLSALMVIDVSDPFDPQQVDWRTTFDIYDWSFVGDFLYAANQLGDAIIYRISDPTVLDGLGAIGTPGAFQAIGATEEHVFIVSGGDPPLTLNAFSLGDREVVRRFGSDTIPDLLGGVEVAAGAGLLFMVAESSLFVYDASDPEGILLLDEIVLGTNALDISMQGDIVYVGLGHEGLGIVDASDPNQLIARGAVPFGRFVRDLKVQASIAYVGAGDLILVDVSDPDSPVVISELPLPAAAEVAVSGSIVVVDDLLSGLHVIDVSDPTTPFKVGSLTYSGNVVEMAMRGEAVYIGCGSNGTVLYDTADPTSPTPIGLFDYRRSTVLRMDGIAVDDAFLYATNGRLILVGPIDCGSLAGAEEMTSARPANAVRLSPNPATDRVEISIPAAIGRGRLAIHDATGRWIRTLVPTGRSASGRFSVDWDGRDQNGHRVCSGIYWVRLAFDRSGTARPLVWIR